MSSIKKRKVSSGMHKLFDLDRFGDREQKVLRCLSAQWYLTNSGGHLKLATSDYDYFLMKPTTLFSEMFNIERELIVVFSPYSTLEPRSLDAFDIAQRNLSALRLESVCRVLISEDPYVEEKITSLLKTDPEQPIVIPFTYNELQSTHDSFLLRNRFREHFYSRDLFSFLSPLKKDLYFFGRNEILQEIVNKHRAGEHNGLFGLRKSGKTSIIYAIERHMGSIGEHFLTLDCESPAIHKLRWYELLKVIVLQYKRKKDSKYKIKQDMQYNEKNAADSFTNDMLGIYGSKKAMPILIIFDEIERISPDTGSSDHWCNGEDFVFFWQTLRSFFQRHQEVFTYMVVGTNPHSIEISTICGHDNPLFGSVPYRYVPTFTVQQTRDMVRKLGRYMGIKFDELIYAKLTEDFGGHPFLIRQFCSKLHMTAQGERPIEVDRALYATVKKDFLPKSIDYLEMIVSVLREWYPDEYDMLQFLAQEDTNSFEEIARDHMRFTEHLIGYGLVTQSEHGYSFNIESLREYLIKIHRYERRNLTASEKIQEISQRRNSIERNLRAVIRNALCVTYGRKKGGEAVLKSIPGARREKVGTDEIDILLQRDLSPLFFLELVSIVEREWDILANVFEMEKKKTIIVLNDINTYGRPDAHAQSVSEDEFLQLRLHFKKLEGILGKWTS